ncbi:galactitol-1-phosphate 5-dehydrogenase [Heyndrickxia oleronia]|uniref:Galactitol-1-phosphate 5-dehydrogenase n=1 Tax=Heyndrickxia oleronia TaxID=38875 RepID=A0A8E2LFJ6_9BACI|nr:galactitol-1-phosphate 5-dehydrogenase [Heyndrickxia oleronia]MEC1375918.1 galactitol-1-phosphate 5-dehydrogenase [Heyndrickxia oleronia]OOP69458.1 galactitol-1-phosphate 5-dehydrogenase [Heyndrickxia oleronia]QQZ07286.1 galactitol-1-phosphate 5-dehydrogenase [Heyndrickxia oleronia]
MEGKMKAAVLHSLGNIKKEIVDIPQINEEEVLIKVKYAGICGSDVPRSMISGARIYPLILGHEFSGEVVEVGGNVSDIHPRDRVVVAPLVSCGECLYCKAGDYGLCDHYNIIGTGSNGAFAEYVKAPKNHVLKIDDRLDFETAAGIEPATIGYHGLQKANIQPGETVVVMGCGSIGQLTLQWAKIFGASTVIAVDIFDDKLELAKELGADITINSKNEDPVEKIKKLTNGGADVVAETAGNVFTQQQSILAAKKKGRVVFIGITHKGLELKEETMDHIMRGEITIQGSWNSYMPPYPGIAWKATLDYMTKGDIRFKRMISHKIKIEEVGEYLKGMAERTLSFNKVLVSLEDYENLDNKRKVME